MKVILAGYSSELINLMKKCNFNISGVVEPNKKIKIVNYNVFLSDNDAIKTIVPDGVVIGIDDIDRKKNVHSIYVKHKIKCLDLILGNISKSSVFEPGLILQQNSIVSENCRIGKCVKINIASTVMHDVVIGDYSVIAPSATILGRVNIGERVYIGANSTILPDINIGNDVIIGAGSVVTKDVGSNKIVKGIPAK